MTPEEMEFLKHISATSTTFIITELQAIRLTLAFMIGSLIFTGTGIIILLHRISKQMERDNDTSPDI